jgi:hypothetical protein
MKIFIWERVSYLTDNYHHEGGCAVIAENLESARKTLPEDCQAQTEEPDLISEIEHKEPKTFIFPDAGCC